MGVKVVLTELVGDFLPLLLRNIETVGVGVDAERLLKTTIDGFVFEENEIDREDTVGEGCILHLLFRLVSLGDDVDEPLHGLVRALRLAAGSGLVFVEDGDGLFLLDLVLA
ncbi:MAG: hypothetical protein IJ904_07675 [Candidatus Methanomethylophilaceae archaeon]|nr:hypothetical protein [Candidatus Methanomethylophilaceae archaeon]